MFSGVHAAAVTALLRSMISFGASLIFFLSLLLFTAIDSVGIDSRMARAQWAAALIRSSHSHRRQPVS